MGGAGAAGRRGAAAETALSRRQLRVEPVMGTVVTIDVREPFVADAALDEALAWLHDVDRRFSMFRSNSEVNRLADGSLELDDASPDCVPSDPRRRAAPATATSTSGVIGRTGAIDRPREGLGGGRRPSSCAWPAGPPSRGRGDRAAGEPSPGRAWRIGIRHPDLADDTAAILAARDLAVATSGLYERGGHIRDPHTGDVPAQLRSMTVVGPRLGLADAFATAAFAMGERGLAWVARQSGFGALAVTCDDRLTWTPFIDGLLIAPVPAPPLTPLSGAGR
jgi:thiamine biosynthesis lipoprotein